MTRPDVLLDPGSPEREPDKLAVSVGVERPASPRVREDVLVAAVVLRPASVLP